jgi:hypothetical protein
MNFPYVENLPVVGLEITLVVVVVHKNVHLAVMLFTLLWRNHLFRIKILVLELHLTRPKHPFLRPHKNVMLDWEQAFYRILLNTFWAIFAKVWAKWNNWFLSFVNNLLDLMWRHHATLGDPRYSVLWQTQFNQNLNVLSYYWSQQLCKVKKR